MTSPKATRERGYLHEDYANSLRDFGSPFRLPQTKGWILSRSIAGTGHRDGMGCYPFLSCRDWGGLKQDLDGLADELVTITTVVDPLASVPRQLLERSFPDLVTPYKQHFLVDLKKVQDRRSIRKQHHRKARKALKTIAIEQVSDPSHALDDWVRLYSHLVRKHSIFGLTAFSRSSFALQLRVPGLVLFMAREDEEAVAATLWFVDGGRAYYHLGASSERGYRACASFALFEVALDQFAAKGLEVVLLGAGAGVYDRGSDGLTRFKAGWATGTRQSYLCGRILSPPVYKQLNSACAGPTSSYFPPYRAHEHAPDAFSPPHYQS